MTAEEGVDWRPAASRELLEKRALILRSIRAFFDAREVLEVETPSMSRAAVTDVHLQSFRCDDDGGRARYMNTSPEFAMKRLLAAGSGDIFQVCKAFRIDESGPLHNPEFTLLEWYRQGFDASRLMDEVVELIEHLGAPTSSIPRYTYRQAFLQTTGLDPFTTGCETWRDYLSSVDCDVPMGMSDGIDEWLDWVLTQCVLPSLDAGFYFIHEYPASQCALARCCEDGSGNQVAARFELFHGEVELANGFDELRDADEQLARFDADLLRRESLGLPEVPIDRELIAALAHGLPQTSGVAMGLDRVLMVLNDIDDITNVLAFPWGID